MEVELGFDEQLAYDEAMRCLNCDVQTVFEDVKCIEVRCCVDICPVDCINFIENAPEDELRQNLKSAGQRFRTEPLRLRDFANWPNND